MTTQSLIEAIIEAECWAIDDHGNMHTNLLGAGQAASRILVLLASADTLPKGQDRETGLGAEQG